MPKPRDYTEEQKQVALSFYAVLRDIDKAAKKSGVDAKSLALWIAGGDAKEAVAAVEGQTRLPAKFDADIDLYDVAPDILAWRRDYQTRRGELLVAGGRPMPPVQLADPLRTPLLVQPDLDLGEWVRKTFIGTEITGVGPLTNPDHAHLAAEECTIGFVWHNAECSKKGVRIAGEAQKVSGGCGTFQAAENTRRLMDWFGNVPTFVIRLDAVYAGECSDAQFAALIEHELYHCGLRLDEFGSPVMDKDGNFQYTMRGHDVEEFVGVVRRYGAKASAGQTAALVRAANHAPEIAEADLTGVMCGSCGASL